MKKMLIIATIIISVLLIKFSATYTINEIVINNYNNNIYKTDLIELLYPLNFSQAYIVYYNNGNILYQQGKYSEAIKKYREALDKNPPKKHKCDVRVNLSLALIKMIDESFSEDDAYNQLEKAKKNLYEDNCANSSNNDGFSEDAEELEEEIKELQEQLKGSSNDDDPDPKEKPEEEKPEDEDEYSELEKELKGNEKKGKKNRQDELDIYDNIDDNDFYTGKVW